MTHEPANTHSRSDSRRDFLRNSTAAALGGAAVSGLAPAAYAQGDDTLKVALIGCGKRGTGAAAQALSTGGKVQLWAMADAFEDRIDHCLNTLQRKNAGVSGGGGTKGVGAHLDVPPERRFVGLDAYKKAIDSGVDLVILTSPPGFRPVQFDYAVKKDKHVFMEKPVATDAPGVRQVLETSKQAKKKNLKVGVGLQRRHSTRYIETINRLHDGAIGRPLILHAQYNTHGAAKSKSYDRQPDWSELKFQIRNWYYFPWSGGDHIVEQNIHYIDLCNWVTGEYPAMAQGQGGREVRTDPQYGMIFDHHAVVFTYPSGAKMFNECRQIPGCRHDKAAYAWGADGYCNISGGIIEGHGGKARWKFEGRSPNPYQVEHDTLQRAIREDTTYNEADYGAKTTMTAIMGRMATYSGHLIGWDQAMKSGLQLAPGIESFTFDSTAPVQRDESGRYPVPTPGKTKVM